MKYNVTRDCWYKDKLYRKGIREDSALADCPWAEKVKEPASKPKKAAGKNPADDGKGEPAKE